MQDSLAGITVIRSYNLMRPFNERLNRAEDAVVENEKVRTKIVTKGAFLITISRWVPIILCCIIALYECIKGKMTVGDMMSFTILLDQFIQPLSELPAVINECQEECIPLERINSLLNMASEVGGSYKKATEDQCPFAIELKDIHFAYPSAKAMKLPMSYYENHHSGDMISKLINDTQYACFNLICALAFLAVGVIFVEKGMTTVGDLAAIYTMYGMFSWHFLQIGRCYPILMNCIAYAERIFEFLAQDEEPEGYETGDTDTSEEEEKAYIDFKHLSFSYDKERIILDDVSIQLKKGKAYALTGETGKGKSTIAKLLLGFYPLDKGNIYIEGMNMNVSGLKKIRDMIAYVPQEPYLFNMSIKENIRYGKVEATDEEIIAAAKIANAHGFILNQAEGYDTLVGERGDNLSGGERQRIAIARAILKNAPILLLDEATSALDNESEQLVQEALNRLMANRTTLMIAHRPSTIALADEEIRLA